MIRTSAKSVIRWCSIWALIASNVAATDGDGRLVEAVKNRNHDAVRAMLQQRVDVNTAGRDGSTALHWAAHWDDPGAADLLIRAGASVNATNEHGVTPLSLA